MKINIKRPLFSAIVMRVMERRFWQAAYTEEQSRNSFEVHLHKGCDVAFFMQHFQQYMTQLVTEFGDPEVTYHFDIMPADNCRLHISFGGHTSPIAEHLPQPTYRIAL